MRVLGRDGVHLTYCLNVHPGSTLGEVEEAVFGKAAEVFAGVAERTGASGPFGLGMWLSAEAAEELAEPGRLEEFGGRLAEAGFYVFTLNGFPYGRFHGARVKEAVYRPDWSDGRRLSYTETLARILASLLPEGEEGSISSVPVTYGPWAEDEVVEEAVRNLADLAGFLSELENETGKRVSVALEPEPDCLLEDSGGVSRFFSGRLFPEGVGMLVSERGFSPREAEAVLRRRLGVCLDAVHSAVVFERPEDAVRNIAEAGVRILKVHLGAGLRLEVGEEGVPEALGMFGDDVYLHQVRVRRGGRVERFADLPEALSGAVLQGEWRVHYHVPLAWEGMEGISTTAEEVGGGLLRAALSAGVRHFEVETYTLDVFPGRSGRVEEVLAEDTALAWEMLEEAVSGR